MEKLGTLLLVKNISLYKQRHLAPIVSKITALLRDCLNSDSKEPRFNVFADFDKLAIDYELQNQILQYLNKPIHPPSWSEAPLYCELLFWIENQGLNVRSKTFDGLAGLEFSWTPRIPFS